nr:MAG TPA: putative transglutaminase-family protein [Caudoviricetes sp.]
MRDRTPTKALENGALRYGVYAEDGSLLRHEYLALEDDPADPGTELRKSTLLQDSTEISLFGSAADRTVDEAFAGIAGQLKLIKSDMAAITLTVQDTNGKPIPDVLVQGILNENGQAVYTNASGVATGYIGEGQQVVKVSGYADVEDYAETLTVVKGTNISKTWKLTTNNFLSVKSSRPVKFTGNVSTIDYSVTSGGGGGGAGYGYPGGGGGAGGGTITKTGIEISPNTVYPATVGAGGKGGTYLDYDGHPGGQSSFMGDAPAGGNPGLSPVRGGSGEPGGIGGSGSQGGGSGGNGGSNSDNGSNGSNATSTAFTSFTETKSLGGGGAGGEGKNYSGASATDGIVGGAANTGGGGSGGYGAGKDKEGDYNDSPGSYGYSGFIGIRMHLKSAA